MLVYNQLLFVVFLTERWKQEYLWLNFVHMPLQEVSSLGGVYFKESHKRIFLT